MIGNFETNLQRIRQQDDVSVEARLVSDILATGIFDNVIFIDPDGGFGLASEIMSKLGKNSSVAATLLKSPEFNLRRKGCEVIESSKLEKMNDLHLKDNKLSLYVIHFTTIKSERMITSLTRGIRKIDPRTKVVAIYQLFNARRRITPPYEIKEANDLYTFELTRPANEFNTKIYSMSRCTRSLNCYRYGCRYRNEMVDTNIWNSLSGFKFPLEFIPFFGDNFKQEALYFGVEFHPTTIQIKDNK